MTTFWLTAALMMLGVIAALAWPLAAARREGAAATSHDATALYRSQLREVDRDLERALISAEEARTLRLEIQRRLLAADAQRGKVRPAAARLPHGWPAAALLALAMTGGSVATYLELGVPGLSDQPLAGRAPPTLATPPEMGDPATRAAALRARLEKNPDQPEGWLMLGRTYRALGRYQDSAYAFGRAVGASGRSPEVLSAWGDALVVAERGQVTALARDAFREAVDKDPSDARARFYLGVAQIQAGDVPGALQTWTDLVASAPPNSPWVAQVRDQIVKLAQQLGIDPATLRPSTRLPRPQR